MGFGPWEFESPLRHHSHSPKREKKAHRLKPVALAESPKESRAVGWRGPNCLHFFAAHLLRFQHHDVITTTVGDPDFLTSAGFVSDLKALG